MNKPQNNFIEGIGNTPLVKLRAASEITGCNIYGKAEYLNPGGSVKDRAALALIKDAEEKKLISKGGTIVEGTAGNTGIGLCLIGNSIGYKTIIVMNEDQTQEKKDMLRNILKIMIMIIFFVAILVLHLLLAVLNLKSWVLERNWLLTSGIQSSKRKHLD